METPPQEPTPEEVERAIKQLLEVLNSEEYSDMRYEFPELKDDWYQVEMGAKTAAAEDRVAAKKLLEEFIKFLDSKKKQK